MRSFWSTKCNESSHKDIELGKCHGGGELAKGHINYIPKGFALSQYPFTIPILAINSRVMAQ